MPDEMVDSLCILWNKGKAIEVCIDENAFQLGTDCIIFISEFHMEVRADFEKVRMIHFDKAFLGIDRSLNQAGDYLLVFYGYHFLDHVPKISLSRTQVVAFDQIWDQMIAEMPGLSDPLAEQLIRNSFQRLMLLSQKVHNETEFDLPIDYMNLRVIREFQYLVETHFMEITRVSDYADILKVSPKKIAELFNKYYNRKPSELIAHRRNLEAQKQLIHSSELIKNIAYDLNFSDTQSFTHFFTKMNGLSPQHFRDKHTL